MRVMFPIGFLRSSMPWLGMLFLVTLLVVWNEQNSGSIDFFFLQGADGKLTAHNGRSISFFCINCSANEDGYDWGEAHGAASQEDCKKANHGFWGAERISEFVSGCMAFVVEQRLVKSSHSAAQGVVTAQFELGEIYAEGEGVDKNYQLAAHWFQLASAQGNADAQSKLGILYTNGQGVDQSDSTAYMWLSLSGMNSVNVKKKEKTMQLLKQLSLRMTPSQTEQAQSMASRCRETNYQLCQ